MDEQALVRRRRAIIDVARTPEKVGIGQKPGQSGQFAEAI